MLRPNETPATLNAALRPVMRQTLKRMHVSGALRHFHRGWSESQSGPFVAAATIAGLMARRLVAAGTLTCRLTTIGEWYARTIIHQETQEVAA